MGRYPNAIVTAMANNNVTVGSLLSLAFLNSKMKQNPQRNRLCIMTISPPLSTVLHPVLNARIAAARYIDQLLVDKANRNEIRNPLVALLPKFAQNLTFSFIRFLVTNQLALTRPRLSN